MKLSLYQSHETISTATHMGIRIYKCGKERRYLGCRFLPEIFLVVVNHIMKLVKAFLTKAQKSQLGSRPILLSKILSARKDRTVLLQTIFKPPNLLLRTKTTQIQLQRVFYLLMAVRKFSTNCLKSQLKFKLIGMKTSV